MSQAAMVYGVSIKGMRQTFGETLVEVGKANDRVVVVDCDTGTVTFATPFETAFPDRYVQMGIAEQNGFSFAVGLSTLGFIPIVPLFACFATRRANDQIHTQIAYPRFNVKFMGCYSGLSSPNTGATHQSLQDVAMMRALPNMVVVDPADEEELRQALFAVVDYDGPVYLRMIRGDVGGSTPEVSPPGYKFRLGKATLLREGSDVTLAGAGMMTARCLDAARALSQRSISAEVINVATIKPLDVELLAESVAKTGSIVTAENHSVIGGLGGAVAEALTERCPVPMRRVGVRDQFGESGTLEDLLAKHRLTAGGIVAAVEDLLELRKAPPLLKRPVAGDPETPSFVSLDQTTAAG